MQFMKFALNSDSISIIFILVAANALLYCVYLQFTSDHRAYIIWYLRNICARKEHSHLFDLFKAFYQIESSHKSDSFSLQRPLFLDTCATCSAIPSTIRTLVHRYKISALYLCLLNLYLSGLFRGVGSENLNDKEKQPA